MPRPPLVLAAVLVATLASPIARAESYPPAPIYQPLAAAYPPGPPPAYGSQAGQRDPAPRVPRRKALMITGLATLSVTYLLTVLVVVNSSGSTNGMTSECADCPARPRLLVPIVGPWLAMPYGSGSDTTLFTVLGLAQATGVVLSIIGISQFVADAPTRSKPQVSFGLLPARDGAFGFASARF